MKLNFGFGAIAVGAFALALGLAACGDGGSTNGPSNDDDSSSSSVILADKAAWAYLNPDIDYGEFTDARDGQVYKTVKIGSQTWMAENLNYDPGDVSDMGTVAWSGCYKDKADSCAKYGRLYTWEVAMDDAACTYGNECNPSSIVQGVCPSGWHLPTKEEWKKLVEPMASSINTSSTNWYKGAGVELKTIDGWCEYLSSTAGTNAFGFSALPAGGRHGSGFGGVVLNTDFWSASEVNDFSVYRLSLEYDTDGANLDRYNKGSAFSVRCVQNYPSNVEGFSSSIASSSSVASSSSAKSSSSVASSSSAKSSSSKANWAYLNPNVNYREFTDERDGQVYKTVKIGTQTWMAENLNYAYTGVPFDNGYYTSDSTSWCYENEVSNCDKYGRLYTWSAVMDSAAQFSVNAGTECGYGKTCSPTYPHRGICPEGWHVPNDTEWNTLWNAVGVSGSKLKSTSGWYSSGNGTDSFGFAVLPAGGRSNYDGSFDFEGNYANFWSSSVYNSNFAYYWFFVYDSDYVYLDKNNKDLGFSVRCLRD